MVSHIYSSNVVVFYDPKYPQLCTEAMLHKLVPGSFQLVGATHLADRLDEGCKLLISFHGPYFPKACWRSLLGFLESGGNIAIFGGMPFARPVTSDGEVELEQDAYTRQIHLGPFFQVSLSSNTNTLEFVPDDDATLLKDCSLTISAKDAGKFWACYPKLTQVDDHPEDMGSAGPFDTVLQPLVYALATTVSGTHRVATPVFVLDQHSGRFRGGRWLVSAWEPTSEEAWLANVEAIRRLLLLALESVTTIDVRPVLGCYQPGETPSLIVTARTNTALRLCVKIYQPDRDEPLQTTEVLFSGLPVLQEHPLRLVPQYQVGLYRVEVEYQAIEGQPLTLRTGFWIWDEAQVEATRKKRLTAGRDYFYQDDHLFLVYGTTYMDSRVQRRFLHLPNPARWDKDMAEMKVAGINLIRTGIWTAWRELVPVAGTANEVFLRALDAFVMTACKHNIQLIFTFFSFSPPLFEGENPWLDPRSIEAQQDFVALLARRYARVELLFWDLINEPSFGDPKKIFAQRPVPHYDRFEILAFQRWLTERYTLTELQLRWRQTPADIPDWAHVVPPGEKDFDIYVRNPDLRNTLKVADYTHFSQDAFTQWASAMIAAIRAGGGQTLVGVGQDEAGARISPQYYASAVDYTTTHPWWNIDDLLWDMLIDKTPDKPNLIQETGIMLGRDIDGRPWRSEQANAYLLERKLMTGLIARSTGVIQWLWHTNSYMTSDNENSIGLLRADGSAKPELEVMEEFGRLIAALEGRVLEAPSPEVWVVIPYAQWFASPGAARYGTQRAVRILGYELGIIPQMIGEHQLDGIRDTGYHPRVIIVPVVQLLDQQAWRTLLHYVHEGGTLLVDGVIGRDAHNLPFAAGIDGIAEDLFPLPVSRYEELEIVEGEMLQVTFADEMISYVKKAHNHVKRYHHGAGLFVWCGLPLELVRETAVISALYKQVIHRAQTIELSYKESPTLISRQALRDGTLLLVASESSVPQVIVLDEGIQVTIEAGRAGALILETDTDAAIQSFGGLHIDTEQIVAD